MTIHSSTDSSKQKPYIDINNNETMTKLTKHGLYVFIVINSTIQILTEGNVHCMHFKLRYDKLKISDNTTKRDFVKGNIKKS